MDRLVKFSCVMSAIAALSACASAPVDNTDRNAVARALLEEPVHDNDVVQTDRSIAVPLVEQAVDGPFGGKKREPQIGTSASTPSAPPAEDSAEDEPTEG